MTRRGVTTILGVLAAGCVPTANVRLADLELSTGELWPPFDTAQRHYRVTAGDLDDVSVRARPEHDRAEVRVLLETVDGADAELVTGSVDLRRDHRLRIEVTHQGVVGETLVAVTPRRLPVLEGRVDGTPGAGFWMVAPQNTDGPFYVMVVDDLGVPVWYREVAGPAFDFEIAQGLVTFVETVADGYQAVVLDPADGWTVAETWRMPTHPSFDWMSTDPHEFTLLADGGRVLLGRGDRRLDLRAWGGAADHVVLDNLLVVEGPRGRASLEWTSMEGLRADDLPAKWLPPTPGRAELVHVNSVQVDPSDGDLLVSTRIPSQVWKLDAASGAVRWRLGGSARDGLQIVDDARSDGWVGPRGQHHATAPEPGRLLLYDNATLGTGASSGDSRAVEYALDLEAGTAQRVQEWASPGAGATRCCGSAQRLDDGHTVVGWGDLPLTTPGHPLATEFDGLGRPIVELYGPQGAFSYRVRKLPFPVP